MSSDAANDEMVADGPKAQPPAEVVAAALEESRLEARLLRVSSTLFLKEAKEYIEGGKASVLLWAGNCLEVSADDGHKAKLLDVRACSEATGVPVVLVEDTKKLGEWVGLGKIGRRRASTCLLAVVLDTESGDDAPALAALLHALPMANKTKEKPAAAAAPPAAAAKAPAPTSSMNTHAKHSYVPATTKLKAALTSKDKLPVLRSTGSYTPSTKRASGDGSSPSTPAWVAQRQCNGASSTPAASGKPGALAASSKLGAADQQPAPAAAQPPSNAAADSALADGGAAPEELVVGTPPQARAKAPVASEQTPEGDKTGAVGPAQVLDGQGKAPATAAQPKGLAAAAEEPPLADRGSTVAQEAAPAGASTPIEGVAGASPSSLEKGENDSLPKAAVAADSGEAPAAKELSISPIVDDEAGADTANGDLPSPAQDVGIWDRLPATSLQPAQASGDNSSSPSGSKENIPMQAQSVPAPAPAPAMGPKPAGVFLIPDAGAASKGDAVSKPAQGPAQSNPVALPSEVSGFRMERRKRTATAPPAVEPLATPANGSGGGGGTE